LQVIRALYDYEAQSSQELSFSRGEFFHVISREDDADWFEACNPALPGTFGLVPVSFFQVQLQNERNSEEANSLFTHDQETIFIF
jgi:bud emergence protein 1